MLNTQPLKGFRDFLPEQSIARSALIEQLKHIFERFGFDPLETPALEYAQTLLGKYGNQADKLLYLFKDHGNRDVGLRYDQTVPLSRVIAQYPDIVMPFKRYQIQPVWRAENTQKGRFREFVQCDIDIVGTDSPIADAEIAACVLQVAKTLKLPRPIIHLNDRTIFDTLGLTQQEIIIIDKLDKIGQNQVEHELMNESGRDALEKFHQLQLQQPTERLTIIIEYLITAGYINEIDFKFDPFLARGLDYYTSTIFELKDSHYPSGSLAGGGRYDSLIGSFTGKQIPAIGVAFGFDRIIDARVQLGLQESPRTQTLALITVFSEQLLTESTHVTATLRHAGINAEMYLAQHVKLEKQLKYAEKKGIPFAIIIGGDEHETQTLTLKHLPTRKEWKSLPIEDAITKIQHPSLDPAHETA